MKAEERERRRLEAEKRNSPIHLLVIINNMTTQIIYGLEGGRKVEGVQVPALHLKNESQVKWCKEQCAKIIRWTAANLERYGFQFGKNMPSGLWHTGLEKIMLVGKAITHYAPTASYQDQCLIQLIVAELAWHNVCAARGDKSREAKYLKQTLGTFTGRFIDDDGEDPISVAANDVYMAMDDILDGSTPVHNRDFSQIEAWSAA